jgi:hypothetical protein
VYSLSSLVEELPTNKRTLPLDETPAANIRRSAGTTRPVRIPVEVKELPRQVLLVLAKKIKYLSKAGEYSICDLGG